MTTFPAPPTLRSFALAAVAIASCLSATTGRCGTIVSSTGSQSFGAVGPNSVDTGNINTGTSFSIGNMFATASGQGYFAFSGTAAPFFMTPNPVTFQVDQPTSLTFSDPQWGSFTSTSISEFASAAGARTLIAEGFYTGGTLGGLTEPNPAPVTFTMGFTQTPAGTGSISFSGTMAIAVPEPSAMLLGCFGLAGIAACGRRRRLPAGLDAEVDAVQKDAAVVVDA